MQGMIILDIEVAFHKEITKMAMKYSIDEKNIVSGRFGSIIDASTRYITHISYYIMNNPKIPVYTKNIVDLSIQYFTEKQLLKEFIGVYNTCQDSAAHYGHGFDRKFLNSRIAFHGLPPLKPIKMHDTWKIIKGQFLLPNNKLDTAIKFFGCPYGKPSLPWSVWRQVSLGVIKFIRILTNRCHYDALSLAWIVQNKLLGLMNRSNQALKYDKPYQDNAKITVQLMGTRCPKCETKGKLKLEGNRITKTTVTKQLSCRVCFEWSHAPILKNGTLGLIR